MLRVLMISAMFVSTTGRLSATTLVNSDETIGAVTQLATSVAQLSEKISSRKVALHARSVGWDELESFHAQALLDMSMDPVMGDHNPVLSAAAVDRTTHMTERLENLVRLRSVANAYRAGAAFDRYTAMINEVLKFRRMGSYSTARAVFKKAALQGIYENLSETLKKGIDPQMEVSVTIAPKDRETLSAQLKSLNERVQGLRMELSKNFEVAEANRQTLENNQRRLVDYQNNAHRAEQLSRGLCVALALTAMAGIVAFFRRKPGAPEISVATQTMVLQEWNESAATPVEEASSGGYRLPFIRSAESRVARSPSAGAETQVENVRASVAEAMSKRAKSNVTKTKTPRIRAPKQANAPRPTMTLATEIRSVDSEPNVETPALAIQVSEPAVSAAKPAPVTVPAAAAVAPAVSNVDKDPLAQLFAPLFETRR